MPPTLRDHAWAIWQAGVTSVKPDVLVPRWVQANRWELAIGEQTWALKEVDRLVVLGAGKASAGMAEAVERVLDGTPWATPQRLAGWVNVPEDQLRPLKWIHLHGARPASVNEPTAAGVTGAERMLQTVASLTPKDLVLCLWSGGGSALLPAPTAGVSLADKLAVTRALSAAGANIRELNTVRTHLSRIKGGGLARACRSGTLVSLIISDVAGDALDLIASGPTVPATTTAAEARDLVRRFRQEGAEIPDSVLQYLETAAVHSPRRAAHTCQVENLLIANNAAAVAAAGEEAERRGFHQALYSSPTMEGPAEEVGRHLAGMALRMRGQSGPDCLIHGGEPTVRLAPPEVRGLGGRNQQLALAAVESLWNDGAAGIALLSGGTDGEDGPTDAAGALLDAPLLAAARASGLSPADFLRRNDAYHFFAPLGGLVRTGPTGTNVCDLRVVLTARR